MYFSKRGYPPLISVTGTLWNKDKITINCLSSFFSFHMALVFTESLDTGADLGWIWPISSTNAEGVTFSGVRELASPRNFLVFNSLKSSFLGFRVIHTVYWPDSNLQSVFIIWSIVIMKNVTDFRKTLETGVDPRLWWAPRVDRPQSFSSLTPPPTNNRKIFLYKTLFVLKTKKYWRQTWRRFQLE